MDFKAAIQFVIICIPFFLLTVWALLDVLTKDFGSTGKKAFWAIVAGIPFIGAFVYLIFGFRKGRKTNTA